MAFINMAGNRGITETIELVKEAVPSLGSSVELNSEIRHMQDGAGMCMMVFEKYFWRNNNYTSLTVAVTGDSEASFVDAVGSGGGEGLLNFSWGSEEDFVDRFADEMEAAGFEKIPGEMM